MNSLAEMCGGVPELRGVGVQVVEHILLVLRLQFEPVPSRTCIHSLRFVPIENDNLAKIIPSKLPFNELNYCDKKRAWHVLPASRPPRCGSRRWRPTSSCRTPTTPWVHSCKRCLKTRAVAHISYLKCRIVDHEMFSTWGIGFKNTV